MNTVAIIQARMGSNRLPGKILQDIGGQPMLARVVERVAEANTLKHVVVATTTQPADDAVVELCQRRGWSSYRGDEHDVLDRFYQCARAFGAEAVVRITSDCPLMDGGLIDEIVTALRRDADKIDYISNVIPQRTYPRGLDIEVFTMKALACTWMAARDDRFREHVTLYMYHHPEQFQLQGYCGFPDHSAHRWTVDTADDLALVQRIYRELPPGKFTWHDVLKLCQAHPEWQSINAHVQQKAA